MNALLKLMALLLVLAAMDVRAAEGSYYEVRGAQGSGYLVGTLHIGVPALYPLDERFPNLVRKAKILALEAPVNPSAAWQEAVASGLAMQGEMEFFDLISRATFEKATALLIEHGNLDPAAAHSLSAIHPYVTYQFLSLAARKRNNVQLDFQNMEAHFVTLANRFRVETTTLENPLALTKAIHNLSKRDIEELMSTAMSLIENDELRKRNQAQIELIATLIKEGELESVRASNEAFMRETFKWKSGVFEKLFDKRNHGLAQALTRLLDTGVPFVALIGASHFGGEDGVINLLRQSGYSVTKQ